jgi:tetratricopeptide (TPR) repeat protein
MKVSKLVIGLILIAPLASTQTARGGGGVLTGTTFGPHKKAESAVRLFLQPEGTKQVISVETGSEGSYRILLKSGRYHVSAEGRNGERAAIGSVSVKDGQVTKLDVILQVSEPAEPQFFDDPKFTIAGVKDNTYRGGHGSDNVLRSAEDLSKTTAALNNAAGKANNAEPHHKLAEADEQDGHPVEAAKEFALAAKINPSEPNLFDWATDLLSHRASEAAAEVYTKGHAAFPRSSRMVLGLAAAKYAAGSYAEAADCFFQATDLSPEDEAPYLFLGKVRASEIIESPGYEERMRRFVGLHPSNVPANYYYGLTLWNKGQRTGDVSLVHQAVQFFAKCLVIDSHFGAARLQLGIIDCQDGNYPEAIQAFQWAIEDDPSLEEAHYRLSEAYRIMGDRAKASAELITYRELAKSSSETREKQRQTIQQLVVDLRNAKE